MTKQGVRNLNNWGKAEPQAPHCEPSTLPPWIEGAPETPYGKVDDSPPYDFAGEAVTSFSDLIYDYSEKISAEILAAFPSAKLSHDYHEIKGERTEVNVECKVSDWYRFLLRSGLAMISLACQLDFYSRPKFIATLLDEIEPGWRNKKVERRTR